MAVPRGKRLERGRAKPGRARHGKGSALEKQFDFTDIRRNLIMMNNMKNVNDTTLTDVYFTVTEGNMVPGVGFMFAGLLNRKADQTKADKKN